MSKYEKGQFYLAEVDGYSSPLHEIPHDCYVMGDDIEYTPELQEFFRDRTYGITECFFMLKDVEIDYSIRITVDGEIVENNFASSKEELRLEE